MRHFFLVVLMTAVLAAMACYSDEASGPTRGKTIWDVDPKLVPTVAVPTPVSSPPSLTVGDGLELQMLQYTHVREAAVGQDGNTISLVLIVGHATNQTYARQLGDNFVRLAMTLLKDGTPGKEIGPGKKYDYLVGIYYPSEEPLALGAKVRTSHRITWR